MRSLVQDAFTRRIAKDSYSMQFIEDSPWPFVSQLVQQGYFSFLDYAFAREMLKNHPESSEEVALLLCFLLCSTRLGHVCISIESNQLAPNTSFLEANLGDSVLDASQRALNLEILHRIEKGILLGFKLMPKELILSNGPLCLEGPCLYLRNNFKAETFFAHETKKLLDIAPGILFNAQNISSQIHEMIAKKILLSEQAKALLSCFENSLTLISGGPGSGKTYTAARFLSTYWQNLSPELKASADIAVAAPTGKAAARLLESLRQMLHEDELFSHLSAKTLHSLLGMKGESRLTFFDELKHCVTADLIIIDEASMIDLSMMTRLLDSIKHGTRLILIGDKDQLPPIELGSPFSDLFMKLSSSVYSNRVITLNQSMRSNLQGILLLANAIQQGHSDKAYELIHSKLEGVFSFSFANNDPQSSLMEYALNALGYKNSILLNEDWMKAFSKFRMIAPMRKGRLGVETLNRLCAQHIEKFSARRPSVYPIMILQNDYRLNLFNGDMGILVKSSNNRAGTAYFPSREIGESDLRSFPLQALPPYEYAFCITAHKSQGSEFDEVLVILPEGSEVFGKELLYTAVTRARSRVTLLASPETLRSVISKTSTRISGFHRHNF